MYAGNRIWQPSVLDVGNDDYFNHKKKSCLDIAKSVFVGPTALDAIPPPGWKR
jgi:hypothetical protein